MKLFQNLFPQIALKRAIAKTHLKAINSNGMGYGNAGASRTKKSLLGWRSRSGDADNDIVGNLDTMRQRSRDLYMSAPLANGALKTIATNVVGGGLTLNSQIDYEFLNITKEEANKIERQIEREFALWAEKSYCCDITASNNFYELQGLVLLSMLMSGDCFVLLPIIKRAGSVYDLKINLIESDRISTPAIVSLTQNILEGVEIDSYGCPSAYYIANRHPNAISMVNNMQLQWKRVGAFGSKTNRRNVLHLFTSERPMQRRGLPVLAPVLEMFKQLSRYSDAEIAAAVISGMFSVFIKTQTPDDPLGQLIPADQRIDDVDPTSYELGNGAIMALGANESIEVANPGRPNTAFDGFVMSILRQIGSSLELPYELLIKHFTASYSASRAAILQAWAMFKMRRKWLVTNFCQPVYEEWLSEAVAKGRINLPGFFEDPLVKTAWCKAEFFGSAAPQIDPLKEANAATVRVEQGFSTRAKEAAEISGINFDELAKVRVSEEEEMDKFRRTEKQVYTGVLNVEQPTDQ